MRKKKSSFNGWDIVVICLIILSAIGMLLSEIGISKNFFSSPSARWLRSIFYGVFTALLMGYVVSKLLKKAS